MISTFESQKYRNNLAKEIKKESDKEQKQAILKTAKLTKEYQEAKRISDTLKTKCSSVRDEVNNLSGGNQQKVLIGKWIFTEPEILLLDEPTRGIDVGAKYEIYCIINQLVAEGKSVLIISSELPEILGICDRIYVMNEGRIVGEMLQEEATQEAIMQCIMQSHKGANLN